MRAKLKKKQQHKLWLNDEIKKNKTLSIDPTKTIKNKKNKDPIR
jgi:hypothetical protein